VKSELEKDVILLLVLMSGVGCAVAYFNFGFTEGFWNTTYLPFSYEKVVIVSLLVLVGFIALIWLLERSVPIEITGKQCSACQGYVFINKKAKGRGHYFCKSCGALYTKSEWQSLPYSGI